MSDYNSKNLSGYLFALPTFIFLITFVAYPLISSFWLSLTNYNLIWSNTTSFIGFQNYSRALGDPTFRTALFNTLIYTLFHVPITVILSMILASLIHAAGRFGRVCQTLLFIPVLIPEAMGAVIFIWIFSERFGLLNNLITMILDQPLFINWLGEANWAMAAIILTSYWGIGVNIVLFTAGLGNIPKSYYEAASIDGAGIIDRFRHITLPSLKHTTTVVFILSLIGSLKVFALPKVMTDGGPGIATLTLYHWVFKNAFEYFDMGYAAAMAFILGLIIMLISAPRLIWSNKEDMPS
ncbi:MAG: sugar ABC transporter permease [Candidatus Latescibacteria bacterium]|jgi:ABC-type sugar transport system permease subunit|nr:sugar ABC transporter permease [Candidatus Latescibacterota bacterium]